MSQGIKELIFLTEDEKLIELCKQYWEIGNDGNFIYTVTNLAKQRGLSSNKKLSRLISENCKVYIHNFDCSRCNKQLGASTRTEYEQYILAIQRGEKYLCADCAQKEAKQKAEIAEVERKEKIRIIKEHYNQITIPPINPLTVNLIPARSINLSAPALSKSLSSLTAANN